MNMYGIVVCLLVFGSIVQGDNESPWKNLEKCSAEGGFNGVVNCAGLRILRSIEKVDKEQFLEVLPGVSLISNSSSPRIAKELKEDLPTDANKKSEKLLEMLLATSTRLISGKTLKIQIPTISSEKIARSLEEGRGRIRKGMNSMILGLGGKMMSWFPMMYGGLALLVSKALIVGKLALVIAVILFFQVFISGNLGFGKMFLPSYSYGYGTSYGAPAIPTTYGTNNIGGWGGSPQIPFGRSMDVTNEKQTEDESAQDYAYSAYKP